MQEKEKLTNAEKARIARNAYMRKWRAEHPEKVRAYNEKHFAKRFDEMTSQEEAKKGGDSE